MNDKTHLNLLGKDYLNEEEAAHYCCVSVSQFREKRAELNIAPMKLMGRLVYRRQDLQSAAEGVWQSSGFERALMSSTGPRRRARGAGKRSAGSAH